jgi:hypothetical protein
VLSGEDLRVSQQLLPQLNWLAKQERRFISCTWSTWIFLLTPAAAFWVAGFVFILVLVLIATGFLHNMMAAFAGASFLLAVSYLGEPITKTLHIFEFTQAIS